MMKSYLLMQKYPVFILHAFLMIPTAGCESSERLRAATRHARLLIQDLHSPS